MNLKINLKKIWSFRPALGFMLGATLWAITVVCVTGMGSAFALAAETDTVPSDKAKQHGSYLIGAGDVLEVIVWREPELSRTVSVRPDGKISLPLVDDIQAAQSTLPELKKRITDTMADFVESPSVYIMLQENRSKSYYMVGMIARPGVFLLERDTSVLQAIATAGGLTEWAKKDDIVILRNGPEGDFWIEFDYEKLVSGKDIAQNILLKPGDVIVVP